MNFSQNQQQQQNQYNRTGLSEVDLQIINMLNNMYTNNIIVMERLLTSNNEIIRIIQSVLIQTQTQNQQTQNNNRNSRRTNQRQNTEQASLPTLIERSLLTIPATIPELYSNSFVLDYQDSNYTDQITELLQTFMTPIIIRPSQVEIENAISLIQFREIENPLNNSCPISLEAFTENEMVTMIKYCGHIFKPNEINHWFESNVRCPVCRYDIRTFRMRVNHNSTTTSNNQNSQENSEIPNNNRTNRRDILSSRNNPRNTRTNSNERMTRLIDNFLLNFTVSDVDVSNNNYPI
jgi:hypothetical protein